MPKAIAWLGVVLAGAGCAGAPATQCNVDQVSVDGVCFTTCNTAAECSNELACVNGVCGGSCDRDTDCVPGSTCTDNGCQCIVPGCVVTGNECVPNSSRCTAQGNVERCSALGVISATVNCGGLGCQVLSGVASCNQCVPSGTSCDGDTFVQCGDDGNIVASTPCQTTTQCSGVGACDPTLGCVTSQAQDGTPCDEGAGSDGDLCNSSCQSGVCVGTNATCSDGDSCTVDSCQPTRGCSFDPPDCSGTGTDCRSDNSCDPSGTPGNCDLVGADAPDSSPCNDCGSGNCTTCQAGACQDNAGTCNGGPGSTPCLGDEQCIGDGTGCFGDDGDCSIITCEGDIAIEHFACADASDGNNWGMNSPCQTVSCLDEGSYDSPLAIEGDCAVEGDVARIEYTFRTESIASPFNIWMRNIADIDWSAGESYSCQLTGVVEVGTQVYEFDDDDLDAPATRHGTGCGDLDSVSSTLCWMALDFDNDDSTYDPTPLDPGLHVLSCTISLDGDDRGGFDGIIVTSDLGFVPEEAAPSVCGDTDQNFSAGTCTSNWGPNQAPTIGACSDITPKADGSSCTEGGDTCCGGLCVVGSSPGTCP